MKVLITGVKGFVGHWLTEHLQSMGDEVIGVDTELDIRRASDLQDLVVSVAPDAVCHLAALSHVPSSWADPVTTYEINVIGTSNVLSAALACASRPRVLVVGSSEVYGRVRPEDLPLREDQPFAPVNPYAASKAASEMVALQAFLGSGLEVVRVRPFNHTGPGQRPDFVVPALAQQVAEAARSGAGVLQTGNLDVRRDLTDVRDVVRAYRELMVNGRAGDVYNVCRGESVAIRDVAERLIRLAGADLRIETDPERLRPVDVPEVRGDRSRVEKAIGWTPEIPLDQTLADVLEYWKRPAA